MPTNGTRAPLRAKAHALPDGTYTIEGLPSGNYRIKAEAAGYLPEFYVEASACAQATLVPVTQPDATPDINFTLEALLGITTNAPPHVTTTSAILSGNLTSMGGRRDVAMSFAWDITAGDPYPYSANDTRTTTTGTISFNLTGPTPGTTCYRADGNLGSVFRAEVSFTTMEATPPVISDVTPSNIHLSSALVSWYTDEYATSQVGVRACGGVRLNDSPGRDQGDKPRRIFDRPQAWHHLSLPSDIRGCQRQPDNIRRLLPQDRRALGIADDFEMEAVGLAIAAVPGLAICILMARKRWQAGTPYSCAAT